MPDALFGSAPPVVGPTRGGSTRAGLIDPTIASWAALWLLLLLSAALGLNGCGITYNTLPLIVNPDAVSFGTVAVGATQTSTITLQNPGFTPVRLDGMQVADPAFAISAAAAQTMVPAGGKVSLQLSFAPTTEKSYRSQLVVMSGGHSTKVPVSGNGQGSSPQPPLPPVAGAAGLQLSVASLQFGNVTLGSSGQQSLTITSIGSAPLALSALTVSGAGFTVQAPALPLTLQPGQSVALPLTFAPSVAGNTAGQLIISSNAAGAESVLVALAGDGIANVPSQNPAPPTPPAPGTPVLTLSTTSLDFGGIAVGTHASYLVTLSSRGTAPVQLQSVSISGGAFSLDPTAFPVSLAPGQQLSLAVSFAPTATGSQQGQITLTDNAAGSSNSIALTGSGQAAASLSGPATVDFGDITVGTTASKTITLLSNGVGPVTISSISVVGAEFSGSPQALPLVLQPNQQLTLKLRYSPETAGDAAGTVTVVSDATASPTTLLHVHGKGVTPPTASLDADASSLSFGQVPIGSARSQTLTVTSNGTAAATITGGQVTGAGFTATYAGVPIQSLAAPITLQPGQRVSFDVTFAPTGGSASNGQLTLSTNAASPVSVSLSGKGVQGTSPALTLSASSLDFGGVQIGSPAVLQLKLTSSGTAPVTISSSSVAGQGFAITSVAYPAGDTGWPATLSPGQQVVLSVTFNPTAAGAVNGNLTIASDASGGSANVALDGTGMLAATPQLTLSASSLSFGSTTVGSTVTRTLILTSSGNAPLTITAVPVNGAAFSILNTALPATLQPNQQLTVTVEFQPAAAGTDTGSLSVTSDDPGGAAIVSLGGSAAATTTPQLTVNPSAVNFGSVPLNTTATQTVTLTSGGSGSVTVSADSLSGAGFAASGLSFPLTLAPGQTATLHLSFDPSTSGAAAGELMLTSNSSSGSTTVVQLSGTGAVPAMPLLTASVGSLAFGSVPVYTSTTLPVMLTSTGTAPVTISGVVLNGAAFTDTGATLPITLNPSQSVRLQVTFLPVAAGSASGSLTVASNSAGGSSLQIGLSGTGTVVPAPVLNINSSVLQFGTVNIGATASQSVILSNTGNAPLSITTINLTGATQFSAALPSLPVTLQPNQQLALAVKFSPSSAGNSVGAISVNSDGGSASISESGTGALAPAPVLSVSSSALQFGIVNVGATASQQLVLNNTGNAPLIITDLASSGAPFTIQRPTLPLTLQPNQQISVSVTYAPTTTVGDAGAFTISSNAGSGTNIVSLAGKGAATAMPVLTASTGTLQFGTVQVGSTATLTFTLANTGNAPLLIGSITENGAEFQSSPGGPVTLQAGQHVTVQVVFSPASAGSGSGSVAVSSNGGAATVSLTGTGAAVPHEADLSWNPPASSSDPVVGYNIYRGSAVNGPFQRLNPSPVSSTTYVDMAVTSGQTYYYKLRSVDAGSNESPDSNEITLTIP